MDVKEVYGIGPKLSVELRRHYNIKTINTLRHYVRKIPDILTDQQKKGLKYHSKISKKITKKDADRHIKYIKKCIPSITPAGSYRRCEKWIGDIDLITTSKISTVVKKLDNYIVDVLSCGDDMFHGIGRLPNTSNYRRIDIIKTTKEQLPFALLYLTGDMVQNITMRQKAKRIKYTLSQYGLYDNIKKKYIHGIKNEKDIFDFLKIKYKSPEQRIHPKV